MRTVSIFVAAVAAIGLNACGTLQHSKAKLLGDKDRPLQMADFPSERRGAWIVPNPKTGGTIVCSEPFSDTGLSTEALLKFTADVAKKGNVVFDSTSTVNLKELQGRTPAVLALRDVMYRMCERRLSSNGERIPDEEIKVYAAIVEVIAKFANAEQQQASNEEAKASGAQGKASSARARQDAGFEALAKCSWKEAETEFEKAESIYPGFQASYEVARALRIARTDAGRRDGALSAGRGYMPADVREKLESCAQ